MALILLVEDEKLLRWSLQQRLEKQGHTVHPAGCLADAENHLSTHLPDMVLLDLSLPDGHGLDFFEKNLGKLEDSVVLVMTAVGEVEDAVRAMKLGALDFLSKPVEHKALIELVNRSLEVRASRRDAQVAKNLRRRKIDVDIISNASRTKETIEMAREVARSEVDTILLLGESGTGKNVIARFIHANSSRAERPYLEVNCAAIPEQLLESELFGHEKGAFTDAKRSKPGTFELADGGTVLLDEIAELRLDLQAKLLHLLENRTLRRVGGIREIQLDVRIIAVTNRNLRAMVQEKSFRDDLYYRISVFPIDVPPLRDRHEDILPLARSFLQFLQVKSGKHFEGFSRETENMLLTYSWPGNVRELRNVVERSVILEKGPQISPNSLILDTIQPQSTASTPASNGLPGGIVPLEEVEREMVSRAMTATGNNQTRAAELLGVTRDQLRYRLKKFGF
ncbi:MAG: sigma-54-dependent transcriptional regulator [Thermoanaerobaculales bacterium]